VADLRGLAPKGWHIPNDNDWNNFENFVSPNLKNKAIVLKSITDWTTFNEDGERNTPGTNDSGFNCYPGGMINSEGNSVLMGEYGCWWSTTVFEYGVNMLNTKSLSDYSDDGFEKFSADKINGFSVRCIKD
jgi:uncharacterized protein (TIGR02145 family)